MSGIKDQENIDDLRKRLYDRGGENFKTQRHELTHQSFDVARGWGEVSNKVEDTPQVAVATQESELDPVVDDIVSDEIENFKSTPNQATKPRSYRIVILVASLIIFVISLLASGVYMFFGANQISANNINISMTAPFAVAGGEVLPIQLSVTNQNSVPIESATIILNYPAGTKSVDGTSDLYEERLPIADINAGEVINVPTQAIVFGEENEDKEIKARIEYRVSNSNGTFLKEASPILVKINSSPLIMGIESIEKISSGQEMDITLNLRSNSNSPMSRVLVSATFPNSFSFIRSEPIPTYGQNEWLIDEVLPNQTYTIKIRGLVSGLAGESAEMQFKAGNPRADNQYVLGSVLTQTKANYLIEQPFIDVFVNISGDRDGAAVLNLGQGASVVVEVKNTLKEAVYDMRVELSPEGNVLSPDKFKINSGFYDSNTHNIKWDISGMSILEQVNSGDSRSFSFEIIQPDLDLSNAKFNLSAKVFARRVNEARASEEMIGSAIAEAKYSSRIKLESEVAHKDSPFSDQGPIPPVANKSTTYTITLKASAGVNDVKDGILTTSLPQHVSWLNKTEGEGAIEFNPVSKQLRWNVGSLSMRTSKQIQFQVSLVPSFSHINRTLSLIEGQEFKAVDTFTGATLQTTGNQLTSELSTELGFGRDNGKVVEE